MPLLPLLLALGGGAAAITFLTGGRAAAGGALLAERKRVREGYRRHEGPLSPREGGVRGFTVCSESEHDLGQALAKVCLAFPNDLGSFHGKHFEMTASEGRQLRVMLTPLLRFLEKRDGAEKDLRALSAARATLLEMEGTEENITVALEIHAMAEQQKVVHTELSQEVFEMLLPIYVFLDDFPKERVR